MFLASEAARMWHLHIWQGIVRLTYTGHSNNSVFLCVFSALSNTANWPLAVSSTKACQTISGLVKTRRHLIMLRHAIGWNLRVCLLWLTGVESSTQTTPGITMHELPRNRPAVGRKWIKFIQFKRADFLAAPHHAHLCSEHFSECDFAANPVAIPHGVYNCFEADTMFRYSFKILPDRLKLIRLYPCGSLGQSISFVFGARVGHFGHVIWASWRCLRYDRKCLSFFSCVYNPQISFTYIIVLSEL